MVVVVGTVVAGAMVVLGGRAVVVGGRDVLVVDFGTVVLVDEVVVDALGSS